jgi:hypothetical protein
MSYNDQYNHDYYDYYTGNNIGDANYLSDAYDFQADLDNSSSVFVSDRLGKGGSSGSDKYADKYGDKYADKYGDKYADKSAINMLINTAINMLTKDLKNAIWVKVNMHRIVLNNRPL